MTDPRRKFTPEDKARIVLEILKEEKSISQLSSEQWDPFECPPTVENGSYSKLASAIC
ncbi:transposase [Paenibacillus agricola]|uniref:transposase n=1 Tax=Paenibacillus agricola TaxID=2716264 RepID=UPI001A9F0D92|nr:transposase [Paenibacillus agricola]